MSANRIPQPNNASDKLEGVWPVLVTPFDAALGVDESSLESQVEWLRSLGVDGIVYPGVASEFFTLSEDERRRAVVTVISACGGELPVVVGISATSSPIAADLARHAQGCGAAALLAMLPYVGYFFRPSAAFALSYFRSIAAESSLPIILQNPRLGSRLTLDEIQLALDHVPSIRYIKEEGLPNTHALETVVDMFADRLDGVFGGLGSIYLIQELERGASGTMPSPVVVDVISKAWRLWRDGERSEVCRLTASLAELHSYELNYNISYFKYVLWKRGIISTQFVRVPAPVLDSVDQDEIDRLMEMAGLL